MRIIDVLLRELLVYIQSQSTWIKDCNSTYIELLNKTEHVFKEAQRKHNPQTEPVTTVLYAAASFMFVWKYMALNEDAKKDDFVLTRSILRKFTTPNNLTGKMLTIAENHIFEFVLDTTYICSQKNNEDSGVIFLPCCTHVSATKKKQKTNAT